MRTSFTPGDVLRAHAEHAERFQHPGSPLVRFMAVFMNDVIIKRGSDALISMFYPACTGYTDEAAREWIRLVGEELHAAATYQVSAEMCSAITAMYRKSARMSTMRIEPEDLPGASGFVWLDDPPGLRDKRGMITRPRAFSWSAIPITRSDGSVDTGIRFVCWSDARVPDDCTDEFPETRQMWRDHEFVERVERDFGRLQLLHAQVIPLGTSVECAYDEDALAVADNGIAWFHVMCMMMTTEIITSRLHGLPKAVRSYIKKHVRDPHVTVITLRRAREVTGNASPAESHHVDWSCRWVVQGHHRHLSEYDDPAHHAIPLSDDRRTCSVCGGRLTWVRAHVKGPDGLPVKVSSGTVYRLTR